MAKRKGQAAMQTKRVLVSGNILHLPSCFIYQHTQTNYHYKEFFLSSSHHKFVGCHHPQFNINCWLIFHIFMLKERDIEIEMGDEYILDLQSE